MLKKCIQIAKNEDGQGMVEYGLILGLVAVAAIVALIALGPKIRDMFQQAADKLPVSST
jgi:pilus assembly protein Flp/PilA